MKQCPECATTAPSDMRFCSVCGTALRDAPAPVGSTPAGAGAPPRAQTATRPPKPVQRPAAAPKYPTQSPPSAPQRPAFRPTPQYAAPVHAPAARRVGAPGTNGLAIAALIVSLLGAGWLAVVFGHIARWQCRTRPQRGSGIALAALILGYIALPFNILFFIAIVSSGN